MGTFVTGALLLAAVGFAVRSIIRGRRNGKSPHCGGDCGKCGGCH